MLMLPLHGRLVARAWILAVTSPCSLISMMLCRGSTDGHPVTTFFKAECARLTDDPQRRDRLREDMCLVRSPIGRHTQLHEADSRFFSCSQPVPAHEPEVGDRRKNALKDGSQGH